MLGRSIAVGPNAPPSDGEFLRALGEFRARWPRDGYHDALQRFVETFRLLRQFYNGGRILDVGGWPGDFACVLASLQFDVTVVDKDVSRRTMKVRDDASGELMLAGGLPLVEKCHQYNVSTLECDIEHESIPLADSATDMIVFTEVIEHLRVGMLHALRELRRVLRPEGRLVLSTPNLVSLRNRISFLTGRTNYDTLEMPYEALAVEDRVGHGGHFRVFSMPEVVDLFERTGFRVLYRGYRQILPSHGTKERWSLYMARAKLMNGIARVIKPLGNTLFLVATRDG